MHPNCIYNLQPHLEISLSDSQFRRNIPKVPLVHNISDTGGSLPQSCIPVAWALKLQNIHSWSALCSSVYLPRKISSGCDTKDKLINYFLMAHSIDSLSGNNVLHIVVNHLIVSLSALVNPRASHFPFHIMLYCVLLQVMQGRTAGLEWKQGFFVSWKGSKACSCKGILYSNIYIACIYSTPHPPQVTRLLILFVKIYYSQTEIPNASFRKNWLIAIVIYSRPVQRGDQITHFTEWPAEGTPLPLSILTQYKGTCTEYVQRLSFRKCKARHLMMQFSFLPPWVEGK